MPDGINHGAPGEAPLGGGKPGEATPASAGTGGVLSPATQSPAANHDGREAEVDAQIARLKAKIAERESLQAKLRKLDSEESPPAARAPAADGKQSHDISEIIKAEVEKRFADATAQIAQRRRVDEIAAAFKAAGGDESFVPDIERWISELPEGGKEMGMREMIRRFYERRPRAFDRPVESPAAATGSGAPAPQVDFRNLKDGDLIRMARENPEQYRAWKAWKYGSNGAGGGYL
jgi:hypothetical protein